MCFDKFGQQDGLPRWKARVIKRTDKVKKPFKSLFWGAGFSFSSGSLIRDCPYEESVGDVFFGEELYMMKLFYNKNYQLLHPPENLVYHLWERAYRRTYKEDQDTKALEKQNFEQ